MAVKESEKTYIECRIFILGDRNVGKKSFINRLLNLPSTSDIRDFEAEKEFNKKIEELTKKIEEEEEFIRQSEEEKFRHFKNKNDSVTLGNTSSMNKKINQISESKDKANSQINGKENKKSKKIIEAGYKINFLPSKIAKSKIYHRPPLPEFPSKLFNIFKIKMLFKPYYITPAEDLLYDSNPKDDEDSDYEFEKEYRLNIKGMKKDINKIMDLKKTVIDIDKLSGYTIYIYHIFLFIYDMTNYSSFETLMKYFERFESKYDITNDETIIPCIIGNKKDKNILFNEEQNKTFTEFVNKYNLKYYEISTKPFYNFSKFYSQLIIDNFSPMHATFQENNFKEELRKIIENKSNFSKAIRSSLSSIEKNPGPEYDLNIFSFNSMKELRDALINKKTRFYRKIFANKQGPVINYSRSTRDILNTDNKDKKSVMYISSGGILNKPITGYTFGTVNGRLNLVKSRRDLIKERNKDLIESIEGDCVLNIKNMEINIKPENYFDEASARKNFIQSKRIIERREKLEKIEKMHQTNLEKIAAEKEAQKNSIIPSLRRSSSTPDVIALTNENKERYYDVVFGKNKEYLNKFNKRRLEIEKEKIREEKERIKLLDEEREKQRKKEIEKEKEKKKENRRREKFRLRMNTSKSKSTFDIQTLDEKPNYPIIKDEFEILLEKNMKRNNTIREFKPRFEEIKKEKINNPYNDQEIWKKWETNKEIISRKGRLKKFLDSRKAKELNHKLNVKKIEKQIDEIQQIRREIIMEKGYEDPLKIKQINYSQVEESGPKYTIKGRNMPRKKENSDDTNTFLFGQDKDVIDYIKNVQMNRPLPNINYVKPNLPSVVFSKAERFLNYNKSFEGSDDLFKDGNFAPKTQENFNIKGTFSKDEKRSLEKKEKSPSPCEYNIKSSFEIIVEKGKLVSDIRRKLNKNKYYETENRKKYTISKRSNKKGEETSKNEN